MGSALNEMMDDTAILSVVVKSVWIVLLTACCLTAGLEEGSPGPHSLKARWILPFDRTSKSSVVRPVAPDYIAYIIRRPSPDGKYVAELSVGDGEVGYITVYRRPGRSKTRRHAAVSQVFANVDSAVWVPRHEHWLAVSTGGAGYGDGMIVLWTGERRTRMLRRARNPEGEGFRISKVSIDGRILIYQHFGENSPDPDLDGKHRYRLRLPLN